MGSTRSTTSPPAQAPSESESPAGASPSASPTAAASSLGSEEGEVDGKAAAAAEAALPPLPGEPVPQQAAAQGGGDNVDDGWDCQWDPNAQAWFFYNRFTGKTQWENPRTATDDAAAAAAKPPIPDQAIVGGYNPAIHGDYDPNAWYAQKYKQEDDEVVQPAAGVASLAQQQQDDDGYTASAGFNRFTGHFQSADAGPGRHSDESKSRRQMNAYFDVDAVASADDGRSLKAERANKRISKSELKAFKEKRKARKEEKRRAWLRD